MRSWSQNGSRGTAPSTPERRPPAPDARRLGMQGGPERAVASTIGRPTPTTSPATQVCNPRVATLLGSWVAGKQVEHCKSSGSITTPPPEAIEQIDTGGNEALTLDHEGVDNGEGA